jgi:hypothetical protein
MFHLPAVSQNAAGSSSCAPFMNVAASNTLRITVDRGKRRRTLCRREVCKDHRPYWVADRRFWRSQIRTNLGNQLSFIGRFIEALRRARLGIRSRAITYTDPAQAIFKDLFILFSMTCMWLVRPERFELPTSWFVARRSIQLSYGRKGHIDKKTFQQSISSTGAIEWPRWAIQTRAAPRHPSVCTGP